MATLVSCASSSGSLRVARNAEAAQNYDLAVAEYTKLLRDNPDSREARLGLERAKLRASQDHFTRARRLAATGKFDEALVEYQLAAELNPGNPEIDRELKETRTQLRAQIAVREDGKTRLESLIAQSLAAPLPGAALPEDAKLPESVVFRDANRSEEHTSELQSQSNLVCRLLLEKKKQNKQLPVLPKQCNVCTSRFSEYLILP